MYDFEVVEVNDPKWNEYVQECDEYDFHHTSCFHKIENQQDEKPVLFVARSQTERICVPQIIKPIPETNFLMLPLSMAIVAQWHQNLLTSYNLSLLIFLKASL